MKISDFQLIDDTVFENFVYWVLVSYQAHN